MEELDERALAQKLTELRKQSGMTQKQLAAKLFISNRVVSKWECGVCLPDVRTLAKLSAIYGIGLDEMTGNAAAVQAKNEENRKAIYKTRMPQSAASIVIEVMTAAFFVFALIYFWKFYKQLPETIALHFDAEGNANGWGARQLAWLPIEIGFAICLVLTIFQVCRTRPSVNLLTQVYYLDEIITDDGERKKLFRRVNIALASVKFLLAGISFFASYDIFTQHSKNLTYMCFIFLALMIAVITAVVAYVIVVCRRAMNRNREKSQ